jgi:hypothetical protein
MTMRDLVTGPVLNGRVVVVVDLPGEVGVRHVVLQSK